MPNKLSDAKMRKTLTEHKVVIALLEKIAIKKNMTIMDLIRRGIRNEVCQNIEKLTNMEIYELLKEFEPKIEKNISSPVELATFKKQQRDFDNLLIELKLETEHSIEEKNSIVQPDTRIKVLEFSEHYV